MRHVTLGPGAEFDAVRRMLDRWGPLAVGIGSDAAVLQVPAGQQLVVSTDTSVEGVHFRREWLRPDEIGYRATAAALSDLAAAAAAPLGVLVSLTVPRAWRDALDSIADGIAGAVRAVDAVIVGGDITRGDALSLTVTVLGVAREPISRSGARPGDAIYVTGHLGGPAAALAAWTAGRVPALGVRARFAHPVPRLREAQWLAARGTTAAIDLSDGLAADLGHLAAASGVRVTLDLDRVPHVSDVTSVDAACGGEEYELVVTAPGGLDTDEFAATFGIPLTNVGAVSAPAHGAAIRAGVDVIGGGTAEQTRVDPLAGYDHFSA